MSWLIDTNVLSELRKGSRADNCVRAWFDGRDCTAIWSHLRQASVAKLVTVYFLNDNDPSEEG